MYITDTSYLILLCFFATAIGLIPALIASSKGHSFLEWWFLGSAIFIIALPLAISLKPKNKMVGQRAPRNSRKCPYCSEFVSDEAQICKHCKRDLPKAGFSLSELENWRKKVIGSTGWNDPLGRNTVLAIEEFLKLPLEDSHKLIFTVYSDTKTYYIEEIKINEKLFKSKQSALISTFQRLIFVDPNEPYAYDCFYNTIIDLKTKVSDKSLHVNIRDKGENSISFSITSSKANTTQSQIRLIFEILITFLEQLKIFSLVKSQPNTQTVQQDSILLAQVESAIKNGDKKKAGLLIDHALKVDFTNPTAWILLYKLIGSGKDFSSFQQEFALKYYPDKYPLLKKRG